MNPEKRISDDKLGINENGEADFDGPFSGISFGEEDGEPFERTWENGHLILERCWYTNGRIQSIYELVQAHHGYAHGWYESGEKMVTAYFVEAICRWVTYFNKDGSHLADVYCPKNHWIDIEANLTDRCL